MYLCIARCTLGCGESGAVTLDLGEAGSYTGIQDGREDRES